ncbi:hypothetical protein TNCV_934911 [Trichonephila clavipes]|nr:hypothetical protein TNCV_934911 [Trichonephila clavipes]
MPPDRERPDQGRRNSSWQRAKRCLSLAVALSTLLVTERIAWFHRNFEEGHLPPTSQQDLRLGGYFNILNAAEALYICKHQCLLRDPNPSPAVQQSASLTTIVVG